MAFTGQLATQDSQLGRLVFGEGAVITTPPPTPASGDFTGQVGTGLSRFGWVVFGRVPASAPEVPGRAENTDTSSSPEAVAVVLKLT